MFEATRAVVVVLAIAYVVLYWFPEQQRARRELVWKVRQYEEEN